MDRFREFKRLLERWNRAIRLVGNTSDEAFARHIEDAMALLPFLPPGARVIDVGSGNGLPAIPLAVARPDLDLTLVEPIAKKVAFLRECRRALSLENVTVVRGRDDELRGDGDAGLYDVAISQATFPPAEWLERAAGLVKPGGLVIAMLGDDRRGLEPLRERLGDRLEVHELETSYRRSRALALRRIPKDLS